MTVPEMLSTTMLPLSVQVGEQLAGKPCGAMIAETSNVMISAFPGPPLTATPNAAAASVTLNFALMVASLRNRSPQS
jgi:hypothetical protein